MDATTAVIASQAVDVDWGTLIPQLGFGGVIFLAFMFLLKWVLKTQEKILDNAKEERASGQVVISGYLKAIEQMNVQSSEFHKQVTEAHSFQRHEHEKLIEGINNVCMIAKQNSEVLNKIKENLDEQGKVLARINGYKHD